MFHNISEDKDVYPQTFCATKDFGNIHDSFVYKLQLILNMNSNRKSSRITTRSPSPRSNVFILNNLHKSNATTSPFSLNNTEKAIKFNRTSPFSTLHLIPKIQHAKKVSKVTISKEQLKGINRSLQISKKAYDQFENRLKNNNFYINYIINPFTEELKQKVIQTEPEDKNFKKTDTKKNIVQLLRSSNIDAKLQSKAPKIDSDAEGYRRAIRKMKQKENQSKKLNSTTQNIDKEISKIFKVIVDIAKDPCQELQEIAAIKEDNFFHTKRDTQPFSLFEVLHNPKSVMFQSGSQQLQKLYFCFLSQKNSEQTLSDFCVRNISLYSRISSRKGNSKAIPTNFKLKQKDLVFTSQKISAIDLFLFANGQLTTKLALQKLKREEGQAVVQQEKKEIKDIFYKQKHKQKETKMENVNQVDKAEQTYWKNLVPTQREKKQQVVSKQYLIQMKNILQRQITILNNRINMTQVHQNFENMKESILCKQLQDNTNETVGLKNQNQRKVRIFKQRKDKTEIIKLRTFNNTLKEKQNLDKSIKKYLRSKSKHKSNSKKK